MALTNCAGEVEVGRRNTYDAGELGTFHQACGIFPRACLHTQSCLKGKWDRIAFVSASSAATAVSMMAFPVVTGTKRPVGLELNLEFYGEFGRR
ncbi:MAG: hypothetical protein MZV65_36650 [Chromatiales bacterium]|nr:hypothetical protein [Chromatiales bacterium]